MSLDDTRIQTEKRKNKHFLKNEKKNKEVMPTGAEKSVFACRKLQDKCSQANHYKYIILKATHLLA